MSPDGDWLAYSTDFDGDERYTVRFRNLRTGEELPDEIVDTGVQLGLVDATLRCSSTRRWTTPGGPTRSGGT